MTLNITTFKIQNTQPGIVKCQFKKMILKIFLEPYLVCRFNATVRGRRKMYFGDKISVKIFDHVL